MHVPKEKNWHGIANFEHCAAVRHHPYKKPHKRFGHSTNICLAIYISICISPWKWQFQIDCSVTIVHCTSSAKYNFSWMIKDRKDWHLIEIRDIKRKNSSSHVFHITFFGGCGWGLMGANTLFFGHHICKNYSCTKSRTTWNWPGIVLQRFYTNMILGLNYQAETSQGSFPPPQNFGHWGHATTGLIYLFVNNWKCCANHEHGAKNLICHANFSAHVNVV